MKQLVLLLCLFSLSIARGAETARPNILFILSDDQRWDALGAEHNADIKTPVLDALAKNGILFPLATVAVPMCCPSRAALVTGLLPHQNGYFSNKSWTPAAGAGFTAPTGIELLRQAGYHTSLIGKWHIKPLPWKCGFAEVRTWMPHGADNYVNPELAHGFSDKIKEEKGHVTELFADDAVAFLNERGKRGGRADGAPFFLWLAFTAPHTPQRPIPERCCEPYKGLPREQHPPGFPPDEHNDRPWAQYYSAITHMDEQCSRVLKALAENGFSENTVVIFLSDNGWMMGSHGYFGKILPDDESIRVPLIVHAPPALQGWTGTSNALVSSVDLTATWLELAGVTAPGGWPGQSILPLLRSEHPQPPFRDDVYCEFDDEEAWPGYAFRMVRTHDWKLVVRPRRADKKVRSLEKDFRETEEEKSYFKPPVLEELQLFDLKNDSHELNDVSRDPAAAGALTEMKLRLKGWMRRTDDPALTERFPEWTAHTDKGVEHLSRKDNHAD